MKSEDFAQAIYALYPPFRPWDDGTLKAWTNTVVAQCGVFSHDVRAKAFQTLTEVKHKEKPPQVATILYHCKEVKRWLRAKESKEQLPVEKSGFILDLEERGKLATVLCRSPMGRQAKKEGWHGMLWAYARQHRRLPPTEKIPHLQRDAKAVDRLGADVARDIGKYGLLGPACLSFWNSVMEHRDKLAKEIDG